MHDFLNTITVDMQRIITQSVQMSGNLVGLKQMVRESE
jgi:hypothetical protein